jgi:hypothetical protein
MTPRDRDRLKDNAHTTHPEELSADHRDILAL